MPIHPSYDTINPQHVCDGPWGGPDGVWISAWKVGLEPKPTGDGAGPYHLGSVVQRGGDYGVYDGQWERLWDESQQAWRSLTPVELARMAAPPKCQADWLALLS